MKQRVGRVFGISLTHARARKRARTHSLTQQELFFAKGSERSTEGSGCEGRIALVRRANSTRIRPTASLFPARMKRFRLIARFHSIPSRPVHTHTRTRRMEFERIILLERGRVTMDRVYRWKISLYGDTRIV